MEDIVVEMATTMALEVMVRDTFICLLDDGFFFPQKTAFSTEINVYT